MKSGSISYSPDYKSEKRKPKYPEMTERFKQLDVRHERLRLERGVVAAAKKWHEDWLFNAPKLRAAVDALLAFASEQEKKS